MIHTAASDNTTVRLKVVGELLGILSSLADTLINMSTNLGANSSSLTDSPTPLCVLGDFAWDVLIRTNSELLRGGDTFGEVMLTPGGSAANVAVWASRCGMNTRFVGKIGKKSLPT
jgi:hypothetical protein